MIIKDIVYGEIPFDGSVERYLIELINTPDFQRLRRIRQLGVASYVFPSAEHTRFAHSLGTAHIMQKILNHLSVVANGYFVTEEERRHTITAALLQDIGHSPFSHVLEDLFKPIDSQGSHQSTENDSEHRPNLRVKHEDWANLILTKSPYISTVLHNHGINAEIVVSLLNGSYITRPDLCSLLNGEIDADRIDYMLRDAIFTGAPYGNFSQDDVINALRIRDNRIVVAHSGIYAVQDFIFSRQHMFWEVYLNPTNRSMRMLLRRAIDRYLDIVQTHSDLASQAGFLNALIKEGGFTYNDYIYLDDSSVLETMKSWRSVKDNILNDLANRFLHRFLPKAYVLVSETDRLNVVESEIPTLSENISHLLLDHGFDPHYYLMLDHLLDESRRRIYKENSGILIEGASGDSTIPIEDLSPAIRRLTETRFERVVIYCPIEVDKHVSPIIRSWRQSHGLVV